MNKCPIATVSLSGALDEKLRAIAAAGFDAVEIFENDLLSFNGSPRDVGQMCRDLGLSICAFQPFRDFEGMPEPQRARNFARAERKFDLMQELQTELMLICSNISPASLGGIDRAAADFRELGDRAAARGLRTGYAGPLSLEIFNDQFRAGSAVRTATDGLRSLILLEDDVRGAASNAPAMPLQPKARSRGVGFIEFAVSDEKANSLAALFGQLGFRKTGAHRSKDVERWSQGDIDLVINCEPDGFAHSHYVAHGPGVCAIAVDVDDAGSTMARAEALKARTFYQPVGPGELEIPAIRGVGGSLLYFLEQAGKNWDLDFEPMRR